MRVLVAVAPSAAASLLILAWQRMRHGSDTWPDCAQFDGCERTADGRLLALDRRVQLTMGWCHARTGFSTAKPHPDALACSHVSAYLPNASGVPPPPPMRSLLMCTLGCARGAAKLSGTMERLSMAWYRLVGGTLRERFSRCHTRAPVATVARSDSRERPPQREHSGRFASERPA